MIKRQIKLKLTKSQEISLDQWLWHLTGVWNWAIRKIELDAQDSVYHTRYEFESLVSGHGSKIGVIQDSITLMARNAHKSWSRCFKKVSKKPRLKGNRNKLNSIPVRKCFRINGDKILIQKIGWVGYFKQDIPSGRFLESRILKKPSGWYLSLTIDTEANKIPTINNGEIGIDPGFHDLLTLSTGEKINHPREFEFLQNRLGQAQRGNNRKLANRIQEHIANKRKDRNHKISRRLVSENRLIAFSADNHKSIAKRFGKSVASSGHYQLRSMLTYKCRIGGREYIEVSSVNSTKTCSDCGLLSGPTGLVGLKVRHWKCSCGAEHDRDINSAVNTLNVGLGISHENVVKRI